MPPSSTPPAAGKPARRPRWGAAARPPKTPAAVPPDLALGGNLLLQQGGSLLGGADRIALLEAIHQTGSMSQAAKAVGISYVTAWDRVRDMNNVAGQTLVHKVAGGSGGGGTVLTPYALELISAFRQIELVHTQVLRQLTQSLSQPGQVFQALSHWGLRTSARNQLAGTVTKVRAGAIDAFIELSLSGRAPDGEADVLRVALTSTSLKTLGLAPGMQAVALLKAPAVHLANPDAPDDPSLHNRLLAVVTAIRNGAAHSEVQLVLKGGQVLVARVDNARLKALRLAVGDTALAQFHDHAAMVGVV